MSRCFGREVFLVPCLERCRTCRFSVSAVPCPAGNGVVRIEHVDGQSMLMTCLASVGMMGGQIQCGHRVGFSGRLISCQPPKLQPMNRKTSYRENEEPDSDHTTTDWINWVIS